jgi:hypothetical protein
MSEGDYGRSYWWIKLANGQEIGAYADRVEVTDGGTLVLYGSAQTLGSKFINLALASGEWQYIYAAVAEDGRPMAVKHWQKSKARG